MNFIKILDNIKKEIIIEENKQKEINKMNILYYDLLDNCDRISYKQDIEYFKYCNIKYSIETCENDIVCVKFCL